MLPPRIRKEPKRASRWKSQAHAAFVRSHACCVCGSETAIEFAHVRYGSGAGMGQKPDDFRAVSLCMDCHRGGGSDAQHTIGEPEFWSRYEKRTGTSVEKLIEAFIAASPKRAEIERVRKERANG